MVNAMQIVEYKISPNFSGSLIIIDGDHEALKCIAEDRIYFVVSGNGQFTIDGEEYEVTQDDVLFVPMNTEYNFIGTMKLFLVCSPEFNKEHDVFINKE